MPDPRTHHLASLQRIMRYLWDSVDRGLFLPASSDLALTAYSDADLGGYLNTRCSTSGYCVFLGASLVSWSSK